LPFLENFQIFILNFELETKHGQKRFPIVLSQFENSYLDNLWLLSVIKLFVSELSKNLLA